MGNPLALMMLAAWPVAAAILFSRMAHLQAVIWTILGGYLLLPPVVGIDPPLLPELNKNAIAALAATAGALIFRRASPLPWQRPEGWVIALVVLSVLTPMATVMTNPEPLAEGITYRPGLTIFDGINGMIGAMLELLPFLLGYMILSSTQGVRAWMGALVLAGLAYSLPMLFEIRLSPQLNVWIYGFFAHDFSQSIRYGGFRPMVFLEHGLWVALFATMAVLSAAVTLRETQAGAGRSRAWAVLLYLLAVLVLCKSVASILYAALMVPAILLTPTLWQMRLAGGLAATALIYPLLLWLGLFPVDLFRDTALALDAERGRSLEFRFINEALLLDRASLKPWAGWGGWGRNLEIDPVSGEYTSVSDGHWIVVMTISGIMGYVAAFGLLCGSVIRLWIAAGRGLDRWTAGLALIMAANLVDLIPNATVTPLTWLGAGALAGMAARKVAVAEDAPAPATAPQSRRPLRTVIG